MADEQQLDVRPLDITQRFSTIFAKLEQLPPGESLLLINDFEPVPLYGALDNRGYAYVSRQINDVEWHIRISRR